MKKNVEELLAAYPDRVPVVVIPDKEITMGKTKFLVPGERSVGEFMTLVRQYTKVRSSEALFLLVDSMLPAHTMTMYEVYRNHQKDRVLEISLRKETTFGARRVTAGPGAWAWAWKPSSASSQHSGT